MLVRTIRDASHRGAVVAIMTTMTTTILRHALPDGTEIVAREIEDINPRTTAVDHETIMTEGIDPMIGEIVEEEIAIETAKTDVARTETETGAAQTGSHERVAKTTVRATVTGATVTEATVTAMAGRRRVVPILIT
jgi:hypothetical protein